MQYSQEHLKTMVYAKFGGQTECIMGNWKIENGIYQCGKGIVTTGRQYWNSTVTVLFQYGNIRSISMLIMQ